MGCYVDGHFVDGRCTDDHFVDDRCTDDHSDGTVRIDGRFADDRCADGGVHPGDELFAM